MIVLTTQMRQLRLQAKKENKVVMENHNSAIEIELRQRNMREILRHKKIEGTLQAAEGSSAAETVCTEAVSEAQENY